MNQCFIDPYFYPFFISLRKRYSSKHILVHRDMEKKQGCNSYTPKSMDAVMTLYCKSGNFRAINFFAPSLER